MIYIGGPGENRKTSDLRKGIAMEFPQKRGNAFVRQRALRKECAVG